MIAILGTGLLGTGFTRALRRRGETVHVWNRTPARAQALVADGAHAFADAADAVRGAARVHVVVSDDAAVNSVLAAAAPGLAHGALVFDHSTTSTEGAAARTREWRAKGIHYQHAPVFMGPQNAHDSTGLMLISGDAAAKELARPLLAPMTGKLVELGERVDEAAAYKLMGNLFLMALTAGLADVLALAKATHVAPADAAKLFDIFNPGAMVGARMKRMVEGAYDPPSWELAMARKDARLMQEEADRNAVTLAILPAIAARMDEEIAAGHGARDWTVIAEKFTV